MADKDINLVIKAKEQATKAIDSVADALRELSDVQKDVGQSASKTDGLLGALKNELSALDKEARGLAALNRVAIQLDKAASAVGRLDAAAGRAADEQRKLSEASTNATANTARLREAADAAKVAYDKQRAAVAGLTAEQRKDQKATAAAREERDRLKVVLTEANAALKAAERQERSLQSQLASATDAAERQTAALAEANVELAEIAALANKASAALGGVEATQEAVAAASAKAAADMERVNRAMQQQAPAGGGAGATVASTKASLMAWREAEAEVKRLAQAMKATEAPSREMRTEFLAAQAAARSAKAAYTEQRIELAQVSAARRTDTAATREATVAQVQNTTVTRAAGQAQRQAATETFRLRDAFKGIYGESRQAMNMFQRMRSEVLSLASAYVGLYAAMRGAGTVIETMRAMEQAQNRLSVAFGGNQAAVGAEMRWLEGEAERLKMSFVDLAAEYGKFAFAAQTAGFATEEMRTVFLGVAEGARVMGLSVDQVQGVLKALDQIISKNKVQAEELRGQLGDRLSGSFQLFAQAIGVSTQELDKMMEQGEVFANRSNMVAFGQKLRDVFGPQLASALETTTSEISDFQANLQNAARQVGEGGLWDGLGAALSDLNEWFKSDEGEKFFTDLGVALGKLMGVIPAVVQNLDKLFFLFQSFAALKIAQVFLSLSNGMRGMSLDMAQARTSVMALAMSLQMLGAGASGPVRAGLTGIAGAITGLRGALIAGAAAARAFWIALGGLPGLLITGLTMVLSWLTGKWLTGIDKATEAINRQKEVAGELADAYAKAGESAEDWRKSLEGVTQSKILLGLEETKAALDDLRKEGFETFNDTVKTAMSRSERDTAMALRAITLAFKNGKIGAEDYLTQIDGVIATNPDFVKTNREMVTGLLDAADKARKAEQSHKWYDAALKALQGTATDAEMALVGLTDQVDSLNDSMDTSAVDAYTAAMKRLGDAVPDIKAQTEFDAKRAEIEDEYRKALAGAGDWTDESLRGTAESMRLMEAATKRYQEALAALVKTQSEAGGRSYIDKLNAAEGTGRNPRSSAVGFGQFTDDTWIRTMRAEMPALFADTMRTGGRAAVLALKKDPQLARTMTELLTEQNAAILAGAGFAATDTNKYLAHFLGAQGALDVLRADPSTPIEQVTRQSARTSNPEVFRNIRTAGDMIDWSASKMGVSDTQVSVQRQVNDLLAEGRKKQEEFNQSIVAGVSQREFEIAQMGRTEREQLVQIELRKAQLDAQRDGVKLSAEQEEAIRRSTEAVYDAKTAEDGRKAVLEANTALLRAQGIEESRGEYIAARMGKVDAESAYGRELAHVLGLTWDVINAEKERNKIRSQLDNTANGLQAQQQLLMDQIEFAQDQGDFAAADALRVKLDEVNLAYRNALLAKRAFWSGQAEAGGDGSEQAAAEVARIDAAILQLDALQAKAVVTGRQINDAIAQGASQAFDRFAQAVAEGKNAWESFGDAFRQFAADFLRQIAQMIIQAVILKMLTGDASGGGGGIGGMISNWVNGGVRHNGGMVGSGGGYRSVWAGHFANATRYHSGGIVGMKPNEVPIIAERGEEVLDMEDPRHRANGGGQGGGSVKVVNMFDPGDMLDQGLATESGERAFFNFVSRNSGAFKAALG